jgi:glyoxylase-like metal-dependent hydrolase (beta-lactamase superfamily II)
MKRLLLLVLVALFAGSCATMSSREQDLVNRALYAMGGADSLAKVKTISVKGTMRQWEPEQSIVPGGDMRFANELTFETTGDFSRHAVRVDWVKKFSYPAPRTYTFSEIVTPEAGYVIGVDTTARNRQNLETNPPAHSMSGLRLAATQREMRRASPSLLLEMRNNPGKVSASPDVTIGGVAYPAASYDVGSYSFVVLFDPKTNLPARIRTLDFDNVWGDVNYDLVLSDWRTLGGIRIAASQKYELNGRAMIEVVITNVTANPPVSADRFEPPAAVKAGAARPATGNVPYQWVLRRQIIGTYLDSESLSFDTRATSSLRLAELAPGVHHVVGGSHNSLIVEMQDYLVVFDAPVTDSQSMWTLNAAKAKYPNKPVKYLVLTHHHMDHVGGIRAYAAQGATLVVGQGAGGHFRKVLSSPSTRNPDVAARDFSKTPIVEVADKYVISDGKREVSAHITENPHSTAYLIGYVADARLAWVTDIWSPGRDPLPATISSPLAALVTAVRKAGIQPTRFAGGHGSTANYAPLAALAGN